MDERTLPKGFLTISVGIESLRTQFVQMFSPESLGASFDKAVADALAEMDLEAEVKRALEREVWREVQSSVRKAVRETCRAIEDDPEIQKIARAAALEAVQKRLRPE